MRKRAVALIIVAAVRLVTGVSSARASLTEPRTLDDKVENAAAIIVGRCVKNVSAWDANRRWIVTYSTFTVDKTIKGIHASELTIVLPGGKVGSIHQATTGVPTIREGHDYVVFIRNTRAGPSVLYFSQGLYEIRRSAHTEEDVVPMDATGVLVDPVRGSAAPTEDGRSLARFEQLVREAMKRREAIRMEMIQRAKQKKNSIGEVVMRNKMLASFALGALLASAWMLVRR